MKINKRVISVLIIMALFLASISSGKATSGDQELARAAILGIGTGISNHNVTFSQLFSMLDTVVELSMPEKLAEWQSVCPDARSSSANPDRYDGMCAVFLAAQTMGGSYLRATADWVTLHNRIGEPWDDCDVNDYFADYRERSFPFDGSTWYFDAGVYFYGMGRSSLSNGKRLFAYDQNTNSMRLNDVLTTDEARLAALRLYDSEISNFPQTIQGETEEEQRILAEAELGKQQILESETNITVTGKCYYVSNDGDDNADGLMINMRISV